MRSCYSNIEPEVVFVVTRDAGNSLQTPTFDYYIKAVLQKEMGYSYSSVNSLIGGITETQYKEGLKANAMAVKMFTWFHCSVYAKHKSESAHVCNSDTCCQKYPTETVFVDEHIRVAINSIHGELVLTNHSWILFASYYGSGNWKSAGYPAYPNTISHGNLIFVKR